MKPEVEKAVNLLVGMGFRVEAPYWQAKAVWSKCGDTPFTLAFVDKDSVQLNSSISNAKVWVLFDEWDRISAVVEEAKAFKREYR